MNRSRDWWDQAAKDLRHAEHSLEHADYEWAAFAAQQSAEKAATALIFAQGGEPWGHSVTGLVDALPQVLSAPKEIGEAANRLDKHYIPTRYPNFFAAGYPGKFYTRGEAENAIGDAKRIIDFFRRHPGIQRAILFGSLVSGTPTPRSDADLLVVLEASAHDNPRDRVPEILHALSPLPCPLDLFVLTGEEVDRLKREDSPLVRTALTTGQDLL